jgi:hypothetical protein
MAASTDENLISQPASILGVPGVIRSTQFCVLTSLGQKVPRRFPSRFDIFDGAKQPFQ